MDALVTGLAVLCLILFFFGTGAWVFVGLLMVSIVGLIVLNDFSLHRTGLVAARIVYRSSSAWELAAIPMFVWMGEIFFRTRVADRLFEGLAPLVDRVPGRLLHVNVLGSTLFAAVSGSSAATTATIGRITTAELDDRGYSRSLSVGSLAGAGSLGLLIPPSIVMIIYGVLAEVSIARLFIAGVLPGLMIAGLYSLYIIVRCLLDRRLAPGGPSDYTARDMLGGALKLLPIVGLIVVVLGSIYTGFATPSEAAAVGVTATLILTLVTRELTFEVIKTSLMNATLTSCMVCSILAAAAFLATAMGYLHVPQDVARAIDALDLSDFQLIIALAIFYIVLGMFVDGISIIVMSLPITLPLAVGAGFDPIWFGIFLVIMVEMGQVTPPVGFNLFVLQGLTRQPIGEIAVAALPFFLLMGLAVVLLTLFPGIALWLPGQIMSPG